MCGTPDLGDLGDIAARTAADATTFGLNEVAGNPAGKLGRKVGQGISNIFNPPNAKITPGQQFTPAQMLQMSGGTILLSQIAAGADPAQAMANFLGVDKDQFQAALDGKSNNLGLDANTLDILKGHITSLGQIQGNTQAMNTTVSNLVKDYPNIMAQSIQTYGKMADAAIQPMLDEAMRSITATAAASGGNISSGASAMAAARAGEEAGLQKLNYATGMATQDYQQQLTEAQALRGFQQTMLGRSVEQGFQTESAMLGANIGTRQEDKATQDKLAVSQFESEQGAQNAMLGGVGKLAGNYLMNKFPAFATPAAGTGQLA